MAIKEKPGGKYDTKNGRYVSVGTSSTNPGDNKQDDNYIYTKTEYENFAWVLENDIIPYGKYKDFESKFAEAVSNPKSAYNRQKTSQGEYMIPVNDILDRVFEGVNNTIVYAKGEIDSPIITRILNIDEYDETNLSKRRKEIYVSERRKIRAKAGGIFRLYDSVNYGFELYKQGKSKKIT